MIKQEVLSAAILAIGRIGVQRSHAEVEALEAIKAIWGIQRHECSATILTAETALVKLAATIQDDRDMTDLIEAIDVSLFGAKASVAA